MPNASVATARSEARLIGFKLGYAMTESKYQGNAEQVLRAAADSGGMPD